MTSLRLWPRFAAALLGLIILVKKPLLPGKTVQAQNTFDLPAWKREQLKDRTQRLGAMRDCVAAIMANAMVAARHLECMRARLASLQQHLVGPSQINSLPAEVRQALIREISNLRLDIEKHELIVDAAERLNTLAKAELRRTADGVERLSKELDEEAAQLRQQALAHRLASLA